MFEIDYRIIIFNMINIFVLYLLMKKFLFGPVTAMMEKRTNAIAASFAEAEEKNNTALKLKHEYEQALESADEKASTIVKDAKQRALEEHNKQITVTNEETAKMIENANQLIALEKKKSMQNIQSEIASIALIAAAKVIQKNVDDSTNNQIINDFLLEEGAAK